MRAPVLLHRHQIDDAAWNALIDRSPHSTMYAYTWYLDVVSPGWKALCVVEETKIKNSDRKVASERANLCSNRPIPRNSSIPSGAAHYERNVPPRWGSWLVTDRFSTNAGPLRGLRLDASPTKKSDLQVLRYDTVMPLPVLRKWGVATLRQPLFCQYLGIYSADELLAEETGSFLEVLNRNFSYISDYAFHPLQSNRIRSALTQNRDFSSVEKVTHWLELDKPYLEIAGHYKKDRRNNLKESIKENWQIIESTDAGPLLSIFQAHHAPKVPGVKDYAYPLFRKLTDVLLKQGKVKIRYATLNGEIHSGVMLMENNGMGIYIFNAADPVGRQGNARTFLLDQHFQQAAGKLHTFDFESPEVESIARFYESFGAEERGFISIKKNKLPFPLRQLQEIRKWLYKGLQKR